MVRRMEAPGARRIALLQELAHLDQLLKPMVIEAVSVGITTRRVGELVGLTGSAVSKWARGVSG